LHGSHIHTGTCTRTLARILLIDYNIWVLLT